MEPASEAQRLREEEEIRERDARRQREKEEWERKQREEEEEAMRRRAEEEQRRVEEEKRRKRQEEEWKRLGSDVIQDLDPVPAPIKSERDANAPKAWYLDEEASKPTLTEFSLKPGRKPNTANVSVKELRELGVVFFHVTMSDFTLVKQIVKERDYKHTEEARISQTSKDDGFLDRWFQEHYNEDEQLRVVTDGSCYFDIRSKQDKWIRVHVEAGHVIILPAGMYHRGCLDEDDFVSLFRCYRDAPRFVPVYRSDERADSTKVRLNYLMNLKKGDVAAEIGFR